MSSLLEQFIFEVRESLQGIGEKLMELERQPDDVELMTGLFRLVHTLKGNSGLFDIPIMTRLLHAGEDLMDAVRDGRVGYSRQLTDALLDAMDLVGAQIDEIEATGTLSVATGEAAQVRAKALRALIPAPVLDDIDAGAAAVAEPPPVLIELPPLAAIPESGRMAAWQAADMTVPLFRVVYAPDADCFFKGEDPFHHMRQLPGIAWGTAYADPWPKLAELDCYSCRLRFDALARASYEQLAEYFRYVPEQVRIVALPLVALAIPQGHPNGGPVYGDFIAEALTLLDSGDLDGLASAVDTMLELSAPNLWLSSALRWTRLVLATAPQQLGAVRLLVESLKTLSGPDWPQSLDSPAPAQQIATPTHEHDLTPLGEEDRALMEDLLAVQAEILTLPGDVAWHQGRLSACAATLRALLSHAGLSTQELDEAHAEALEERNARPLADWLQAFRGGVAPQLEEASVATAPVLEPLSPVAPVQQAGSTIEVVAKKPPAAAPERRGAGGAGGGVGDEDVRFGRRSEDTQASKVLKVDQVKVDRLMNLIGEMVVAKNSLPYLANRAENQYGVRELAREIKAQYTVINRIAEEMQDAIMQVRMMPVSFVFQRFPRMVRDISHKLGKEVQLVLEGEETEADKNIVEMLADPLIHIVRNSLDHGLETAEVRLAAGKPAIGRLLIRALQESDRAVIEIIDDGRGIDPAVIKRKAYDKGLIDEEQLERISDQDAINLVFAAGFSTVEQISDLSGRGVGMDVVRSALDKVGGTVQLSSTVGKGTVLRLSLPLSMAVTNVMIVETDKQIFGLPMDTVVETVRLHTASIRTIKRKKTIVLRGKIVPVVSLNELLAIDAPPKVNADGETAALVVRIGSENCALLVDQFREVVDVILKPLPGELAKLSCYAGTALLGDGSVLMVLNPKELF
ncbi:MAG: chemotaxis protein CheA [Rhodoferax sp.]|nr:chemotaxis protein CheA [Rhodoferax sp.]